MFYNGFSHTLNWVLVYNTPTKDGEGGDCLYVRLVAEGRSDYGG